MGPEPDARPPGHGLVVVGSHVGLTSRQIDAALRLGGLAETEVRVAALLSGDARHHIADVVAELRATLQHTDALLHTSRTLTRGSDAATSLDIARRVSNALVEVVRNAPR